MFDIFNIFYILIIFLIVRRLYKIKDIYFLFLLLHLFSIFLFNGFLFEPSYMPDQFKYLEVAQNIRNFDFFDENSFNNGMTVYLSGVFFGLFPIPFISSLYSIAMINFMLYLIIFVFMYNKDFFNSKFIIWFYILYPSLGFYSSLSLRDMLIFFIMFYLVYYLIIKMNYYYCLVFSLCLWYIKFQNLAFILSSFIISLFKLKLIYFIIFVTLFLIFYFGYGDILVEKINEIRYLFYLEQKFTVLDANKLIPITFFDMLIHAPYNFLLILFKPLIWEEYGIFQIFQFIENSTIFVIILYIVYLKIKFRLWNSREVKFLNYLLIISTVIYGTVLFNSGTIVRYKFPIITIYIIYSWYFIYQAKQLHKENKQCVE